MTRKDIIRVVSAEVGLPQIQTSRLVQNVLGAIVNTLAKDGRVELRNFGVFTVKWRKSRKGRNPSTGEKVFVPEKCTVTFKAGQALAERVQSESQAAVGNDKNHGKRPAEGTRASISLAVS